MPLTIKHIVVTGAAGTLGQAVCRMAQNQGATVTGVDIVKADSMSNTDSYHQLDLLDSEAVAERFSRIPQIDALINVAGGFAMGMPASSTDNAEWELMFKLNVETMRNAVKAATPSIKNSDSGAIVNIGAYGALSGQAQMSAYCASKSTVMRLTESLSEELKGDGVNVNAVLPTIIDTPPNRSAMPDEDHTRWVSPEQLAEVICFLASDRAKAIHGALIPVKGQL